MTFLNTDELVLDEEIIYPAKENNVSDYSVPSENSANSSNAESEIIIEQSRQLLNTVKVKILNQ